MKLMHLSDLHLGKRLIDVSLLEDQKFILDQIIHIAAEEQPKVVMIAGDVYDRSNPPAEAMTLFAGFLRHLTALGSTVLVISGNHDSSERVAYLGELVRENGVYLSPVYDGHIEPVCLFDEYGEVRFYLMPYIHPASVCQFFPDAEISSSCDAARTVLRELNLDPAVRNVILSHQFISGSAFDDPDQRAVGTLDSVDASLFDSFDYVALGHIHRPQAVGRKDGTMRYCGSPLKYSQREAATEKSVTFIDLGPKGNVRQWQKQLKPLREVHLVRGAFDRLIEQGPVPGTENDYYFITLTNEEDIANAAAQLRQRFGKVLALDFDNARTRAGGSIVLGNIDAEQKRPIELLMELYRATHHTDMSDEARAFAEQAMRETEGFDE